MYEYQAKLIRVIDADTLVINVDLGFRVHQEMIVRLYGIDCPERFTEEGKQATIFVQNYFKHHPDMTITTFQDKQDKYGRYLASIRNPIGNLALLLIDAGHIK